MGKEIVQELLNFSQLSEFLDISFLAEGKIKMQVNDDVERTMTRVARHACVAHVLFRRALGLAFSSAATHLTFTSLPVFFLVLLYHL